MAWSRLSIVFDRRPISRVRTAAPNALAESLSDSASATGRLLHRVARNLVLILGDGAMLVLSVFIAYVVWAAPERQQSPALYINLWPLLVLFVAGYARAGLYPSLGLGPVETLRRVSLVTTFGFLVLASFSFALQLPHRYSRVTFAIAFVLSLLLVPLGRVALFYVARKWHWWAEPVVIVGTGRRAARVTRDIKRARHLGYRPAAIIAGGTAPPSGQEFEGVPIVGGLEMAPALAASGMRVAFLEVDNQQMRRILDQLQQSFRRVILLHEIDDLPVEGVQVRNLGNLVGIEYTNNLLRPVNQTAKRMLDLAIGGAVLLFLLPIIVTAGLLVLVVDGGPVFFQQRRSGLGGRTIWVPKIRTMRRDAERYLADALDTNPAVRDEWESRYKLKEDPRLIPGIGRFFRRFSVDELPQLWSVIVGDMSLVGPRPFPDYHIEKFSPAFRELRHRVRPGITGLWQVTVRSEGGIEEQEGFDTHYIRNWSVWFDLYVLSRTVVAVASGRGAY